ncbi:MAG: HAD domain-containing protein [Hylemonella sp.]|uniref:HAD domain-containing protein n=1 Tax=Hylemonella sp. TaxID=2066020 RepID=UPI00391C91ED
MSSSPHVIYLDFDGVLHPDPVRIEPGGELTLDQQYAGHQLFENAQLLTSLLHPYPSVSLVLATSWVPVLGYEAALKQLPAALRARVIGSTFDHGSYMHFSSVARGYQILADSKRRGLKTWAALDDDARDWPRGHRKRLIQTDKRLGLAAPGATEALSKWLLDASHLLPASVSSQRRRYQRQ